MATVLSLIEEKRIRIGEILRALCVYCGESPRIRIDGSRSALSANGASYQLISQCVSNRLHPPSILALGTSLAFLEVSQDDPIGFMLKEVWGNASLRGIDNLNPIKNSINAFCMASGTRAAAIWPAVLYVTRWQYSAMFLLEQEYGIQEDHIYQTNDQIIVPPNDLGKVRLGKFERASNSEAVLFGPADWVFADQKGFSLKGGHLPILRSASDRIGKGKNLLKKTRGYEERILIAKEESAKKSHRSAQEILYEEGVFSGLSKLPKKLGITDLRIACVRFMLPKGVVDWQHAIAQQLVFSLRPDDLALVQQITASCSALDFFLVYPQVEDAIASAMLRR